MGRRAQKPELEFGSDSFLDVVCNIVGILIILIVVVAVKVERQPLGGVPESESVAVEPLHPGLDDDTLIAERNQTLAQLRASEHAAAVDLDRLKSAESAASLAMQKIRESQELARQQLEARQAGIKQQKQQQSSDELDRRTIAARVAALQQTIGDRSRNALKLGQALVTTTRSEQELDEKVRTVAVETLRLQEVLVQAQQATVPQDRLQHRLSPVTKSVEKDELHFRVENGRVSQIPIEELLERLKAQVLARRSTVIRFNQFEGIVGPVGGYNMTYVVEKEGPSALESLQSGDGRVRINVSRWTIAPDDSLVDESIEVAVRPGSRYRQIVETASPDTVVTMWIYPDSFTGFAPLREVAHGLQLRVAARPLPSGTPIVGSPNGSRSTAQ